MKVINVTILLFAAFALLGCATTDAETSGNGDGLGSTSPSDDSVEVRTAYEGETGPKLLMERYQSGEIEGFRAED